MTQRVETKREAPPLQIINLTHLCKKFGINRKILTATMAKYDHFPVLHVGTGPSDPYKFDLVEVEHWIDQHDWWRGTREPAGRPPKKRGNAVETARNENLQRETKNLVQTELLKLELDKKRGLLVDREEVVALLSSKMARMAKQLELLPNLIGKKLSFSDEAIRMFRDHLDQARHAMVNDDDGYFARMDEFKDAK